MRVSCLQTHAGQVNWKLWCHPEAYVQCLTPKMDPQFCDERIKHDLFCFTQTPERLLASLLFTSWLKADLKLPHVALNVSRHLADCLQSGLLGAGCISQLNNDGNSPSCHPGAVVYFTWQLWRNNPFWKETQSPISFSLLVGGRAQLSYCVFRQK